MTAHDTLDRLFAKLSRHPQARNALMAVEAPGLSWRGAPDHLRADSQFRIASCGKLHTAALVLQLVEAGQLRLEAPAAEYLPAGTMTGLHVWRGTDRSAGITVGQLLSNTSGLANYFDDRPRSGTSFMQQVTGGGDLAWTLQEALDRVRTQLRPKFPPGAPGKAFYSDTNFQLLGAILEGVTGQSYASLVEQRIAQVLGLSRTYVFTRETIPAYDSLVPVSAGTRQLRFPNAMASVGAQGGVISTLDDSLAFLRAFMAGRLFPQRWIARMQDWNRIFFPFRYGLGMMQFSIPRILSPFRPFPPMIGHSGSTGVVMFHSPEREIFVCGSTNQVGNRSLPYQFMARAVDALR